MNNQNKYNLLLWGILLVATVALFLFYFLGYKYHFYYQEQTQIFLNSPDWIASYLYAPGWLVNLAGDWLTQFYYYIAIGPLILSCIISLSALIAYAALKGWMPKWLSFAIAAALFLYLAFSSFASNSRLSMTLCVMGWLVCLLICKQFRWWGLMSIPITYWLCGFGSWPTPSLPNFKLEHRWAIENEYYFGNYDKAIQLARTFPNPNPVTSFYYYLSQAQKSSLADSLLNYPLKDLGTLIQIGENTPLSEINMMNELYFTLGDMTYSERAAMMNCVFSPCNRNVRMIKRLAEVNLISGDTIAAMKYLRILSNTHAYKQWALSRIPDNYKSEYSSSAPNKDTSHINSIIDSKRQFINKQDTMRLGDNCYTILVELLESNPDNLVALDYLLCTDLILKDMDTFKNDYDRFCLNNPNRRNKPLYQQALMIYLSGTNAAAEDWRRYITNPHLMSRFMEYNQHRGNPAFADTYWYYFDTAK